MKIEEKLMRKLAFDLRTKHLTGIYRYGSSILQHLSNLLPGTGIKLYVLYRPDIQGQVEEALGHIWANNRIECVLIHDDPGRVPHCPRLQSWLLRANISLYYSIDFLVDRGLPIPFVYTVHDLIPLKYPELFYTDELFRGKFGAAEFNRMERDLQELAAYVPAHLSSGDQREVLPRYAWAMSRYSAERSKHIVTVSESVREDIMEYLAVPRAEISVIPGAADPACFYQRDERERAAAVKKFGLPESYCLCIGRELKHKRLPWLLEILAQYQEDLPHDARIVIVGNKDDLIAAHAFAMAHHLEHRVVFTGRVSDDELACLYSGAKALIISSRDEGFCLPAIEALACGTEVIVPGIQVLREVVGAHGHFYGMHDGDALAHLLTCAFRDTLTPKAPSFTSRFSWEKSAQQLLELFISVSQE